VCAGDISIFEREMDKILARLDSFGKPILIIHGNHESEEHLAKACKGLQNVEFFHKKAKIINNVLFMGYGGGGFDKHTPELADFFRENKEFLDVAKHKVFIFHAPPKDTRLDFIGKNHNGSQTERMLIFRHKPDLVVCGHFHENFGKSEYMAGALVVNPGPLGWIVEV
jgi:Icc-related predicted phosphoesterase